MVKFGRRVKKKRKLDGRCLVAIPIAFIVGLLLLAAHLPGPQSGLPYGDVSSHLRRIPSNPPGTCVQFSSKLPDEWRASASVQKSFSLQDSPWTEEEQKLANEASEKGLQELVNFYDDASDETIIDLETDAVNSMIDCVYSSGNLSEKHRSLAIQTTIRVLKINAREYVTPEEENWHGTCKYVYQKMKLAGYAQYLLVSTPEDKELEQIRNMLRDRLNASFKDCGSISSLLGYDVDKALTVPDQDYDTVLWDWMSQSIALVDCMTIPGLQLPDGTEKFIARVWEYFSHYRFKNARDYPDGYEQTMAYLATHVAYIPTGYGRHIQLIDDAPWLYRYVRENFYAAMETESSDLISEFVDLVRQYGCDEDNDVQVRDGTRYLLRRFAKRGYKWMKDDDEAGAYDLIHGPWTGVSGVERREPEPVVPGSYGNAFYAILQRFKR